MAAAVAASACPACDAAPPLSPAPVWPSHAGASAPRPAVLAPVSHGDRFSAGCTVDGSSAVLGVMPDTAAPAALTTGFGGLGFAGGRASGNGGTRVAGFFVARGRCVLAALSALPAWTRARGGLRFAAGDGDVKGFVPLLAELWRRARSRLRRANSRDAWTRRAFSRACFWPPCMHTVVV